jgi:transcriptional regulator with XRE-family HTH domain
MSTETGIKIKRLREFKNYTQQHLADSLGLSQNAYSKIENGTTKLTVDRLEEIAKIFDVPVENILTSEKQSFNLENNQIDKFYGYIENLHEENKEILQAQIEFLQQQNEKLIKTIENISNKIK